MKLRHGIDLVAVGSLWGVSAYLLGGRAFGSAIWPGVLAAPAIALVVGLSLQRAFERGSPTRRKLTALCSLYFGGTLFGLVIGLGSWLGVSPGSRQLPSALLEPVLGVWWGLTLTGFVLALWPLAYVTHWWLEWRRAA